MLLATYTHEGTTWKMEQTRSGRKVFTTLTNDDITYTFIPYTNLKKEGVIQFRRPNNYLINWPELLKRYVI